MSVFETLAALISLAAGFAYVNHRWLRQPTSIALMAMSLALSLVVLGAAHAGFRVQGPLTQLLTGIDFDQALLHGMLGALLFAGALHVRLADLRDQWPAVAALALVSTVLSTLIVGTLAFLTLPLVGVPLAFGHCLLFGAIISPTDPIAVLGILKQARVPPSVEVQIGGESLFNDGIGVVLFTTIAATVGKDHTTAAQVGAFFVEETLGGVLFGLASGYLVFHLLRSIDHYQTELLLTLSLVLAGYALAERLHVSAPISAVVAGLVIGNHGRARGMSDVTRDYVDKFWSLVDEILNAVLFVMMGLEVAHLSLSRGSVLAGLTAIPVVLFARWLSVALPIGLMARRGGFARGTIRLLTWGGLRGGISLALALSLPGGDAKIPLATMTYMVVAFSILTQGLTLERLARRFAQ